MIIQIGTEVDESRILWKRKESDEWERADIDDLIEAYENRPKEPKPGDSISRQALIDEILEDGNGAVLSYPAGMYEDELVERIEEQMIKHFIGVIEYAPPVEPKIYGDEHNCIMTLFGECSYPETGWGDCAVVEKVRDALKGECPPVEPVARNATPTGDCISRQATISALQKIDGCTDLGTDDLFLSMGMAVKRVLSLPPATPTERTGKWKHTMTYYPYCSECEWFPEEDEMRHGHYDYCPNCGAKMKGGTEND